MRLRHLTGALVATACATLPAAALALDLDSDRLELHGAAELQVRSIVRDYDFSQDWDVTQWANVLSLELEADLLPASARLFDSATLFARVELRYDCVWTQVCTLFHAADAYRVGHTRRLPKRLVDARRTGFDGTLATGDRRHYYDVPLGRLGPETDPAARPPSGSRDAMGFWQTPLGAPFFSGNASIASLLLFDSFLQPHCDQWGARDRRGPESGRSPGESLPLDPACRFDAVGQLADKPNPWRRDDVHPLFLRGGQDARPYRPAPRVGFLEDAPDTLARGIYYPNARLRELLDDGDVHPIWSRMSRSDLAWNHGEAQEHERELKELTLDLELLDRRLWIRTGYQTIVWGKTELFRNQDVWNPQDLALASLPTLEGSRLAIWAVRALWSFGDVGALEDVRLELAATLDRHQANDYGLCGEPYTILAACATTRDQIVHGLQGTGLAGRIRPPAPWEDVRGIDVGARLEWRWRDLAFSVTDFWGYHDTPYVERIFTYGRNVDPLSGRPRRTEARGGCGDGGDEACLTSEDALTEHHANQQLFALMCAYTLGTLTAAPEGCVANAMGSTARTAEPGALSPRALVAFNMIASGDGASPQGVLVPTLGGFTSRTFREVSANTVVSDKVTVDLHLDPRDGGEDLPARHPLRREPDFGNTVNFFVVNLRGSLSARLSDEQEALLGCGPIYETSCDLDGIDLLNTEASILFESFPLGRNALASVANAWDTTDRSIAQPGTVGFPGEPACTRFEDGRSFVLPGCRGPGERGYDPGVDGTTDGLLHPFTGQRFRSEMSALSWNLMMALVALTARDRSDRDLWNPDEPFRKGACSFAAPQWCAGVRTFFDFTGARRATLRAGGNGRFGRRDFAWHGGGSGVQRVARGNVLGVSLDFPERWTQSTWALELTWWNDLPAGNFDAEDGISEVDAYRLTISIDRPTYVEFLQPGRAFLLQTQWFVQYLDGWERGFAADGPWDVFGTLTVTTGYLQDRLLPALTLVYFVRNDSFGVLPQVTWRFSESASATVGLAAFAGREQERPAPLEPLQPAPSRLGRDADHTFVENGLALIRDRDELFLRLRWTF